MAYQEYSITSLDDVPSLVRTFAAAQGWTVAADVITRPGGGLGHEIGTVSAGLNHDLFLRQALVPTRRVRIRNPIWATDAAPTVGYKVPATKLFLIGMLDPQPYIGIVVEFGYNLYRHLYLGNMEKSGVYDGGEVISCCDGMGVPLTDNPSWRSSNYKRHLFQGHCRRADETDADAGGINIIRSDNPEPWCSFRDLSPTNNSESLGQIANSNNVFGGFGDDVNDGYVAKGKAPLAGANVLVPQNLLVSRWIGTAMRFKPIGIPSGIRALNIEEVEPQAQIEVGGENWYVFAAISKQSAIIETRPGGGQNYRKQESSYFLGYAYRG